MSQVKEAIEHLCQFFHLIGFKKISAEDFRKAKFNQPSAINTLQILLAEIMIVSNLNWKVPQDLIKKVAKLEEDNSILDYIKQEMLLKGYFVPSYVNFENNEDSREILFGIAWVIAKYSPVEHLIIEKINNTIINKEEFLKSKMPPAVSTEMANAFSKSEGSESTVNTAVLQQLLWLMGKVRIYSNKLQQLQLDRLHLMSKIHSFTENSYLLVDCSHLNIIHTQLLKSPSLLNQYIQTLKKEIHLMNVYVKWKEKETIFWKWMVNIWETHLQEKINAITVEFNFTVLQIIKEWYLFLEKKKLTIKERSEKSKRLLCQVPLDNNFTMSLPSDIRFVKLNKKLRNQPETILQIIKKLDLNIVALEEELKHNKKEASKCFNEMSKKFEDIICIPPIKHRFQ